MGPAALHFLWPDYAGVDGRSFERNRLITEVTGQRFSVMQRKAAPIRRLGVFCDVIRESSLLHAAHL